MLNPFELTGRAASHVTHSPALGCSLHREAVAAYVAMRHEALQAGIALSIVSGFRDFQRQMRIWTDKFNGTRSLYDRGGHPVSHADLDENALIDTILVWSALPGASRHHWGSELDVIDSSALPEGSRPQLSRAEFTNGGCFERLNAWLAANMARFGFFRPYSTDRGGVSPEPWHLSLAAVALPATAALSVQMVASAIEETNMPGRDAVLARLPELYARYVLEVDPP